VGTGLGASSGEHHLGLLEGELLQAQISGLEEAVGQTVGLGEVAGQTVDLEEAVGQGEAVALEPCELAVEEVEHLEPFDPAAVEEEELLEPF